MTSESKRKTKHAKLINTVYGDWTKQKQVRNANFCESLNKKTAKHSCKETQNGPQRGNLVLQNMTPGIHLLFEKTVAANINQGHSKYGESAGKKCVAICLFAISFACLTDLSRWTPKSLDRIIGHGDIFYVSLGLNRYLEVDDLPLQLSILHSTINVSYNLKTSGILTRETDDIRSLILIIEQNSSDNNGFLIIPKEICIAAILKHSRKSPLKYHMFDSHSRNLMGQFDGHGTGILVTFNHISHFVSYLCSTYLNDNNNNRIPYVIQFISCTCLASSEEQKNVVKK